MVFTTQDVALIGLIGVFIGGIAGNRLAIGRDRRREFNALIDPIRSDLIRIQMHASNGLKGPWVITFPLIREQLSFWKRRGFDRAIEHYKQCKDTYHRNRIRFKVDGPDSPDTIKDAEAVKYSAGYLLNYLKRR